MKYKVLLIASIMIMGCCDERKESISSVKMEDVKTYDNYCNLPMPDGYCIAQSSLTGEYIVRERITDILGGYNVLKTYDSSNVAACRLYANTLDQSCKPMMFIDTCEAKYYIIEYLKVIERIIPTYYKPIN